MKNKTKNLIVSLLLSALGTAFLIYYIFRASTDVVASDYMRIINYYLKDVGDLHFLFSWEGISRIPFTFLARFINVKCFGYSVFFDKILGTFGLFLFNAVVVDFILNNIKTKPIKIIASLLITYISFSLMAWEMILNGTGYAHFLTVGLIALTFRIFASVVGMNTNIIGANTDTVGAKHREPILLCFLIIFTSILFAGSYTVSYNCTLIFFSVTFICISVLFRNNKRSIVGASTHAVEANANIVGAKLREPALKKISFYLATIIISIICLLLYFKSNSIGEALIPVGFKDITLVELLKTEPMFPLRFLLKSLASSIIGVETFDYALNFGTINEKFIFFIGFLYLIVIIYAIILLIIKIRRLVINANEAVAMEQESHCMGDATSDVSLLTFVSMFIVYGIANYALVFLARYKFVVDSYGMTSRYSLQYMFLTIGIIMLLIKLLDDILEASANTIGASVNTVGAKLREPAKLFLIVASILSLSFITLGHLTTNTDEIFKSDYRKIIYSIVEEKAKNYKNLTDQDLEDTFEYHRGPEQIREALATLESQHLNVFKDKRY